MTFFVFVFMAATLQSSLFKGFYYYLIPFFLKIILWYHSWYHYKGWMERHWWSVLNKLESCNNFQGLSSLRIYASHTRFLLKASVSSPWWLWHLVAYKSPVSSRSISTANNGTNHHFFAFSLYSKSTHVHQHGWQGFAHATAMPIAQGSIGRKNWVPGEYTWICSQHFISGGKVMIPHLQICAIYI